jgi:hypothetical protein
MSKEFSPTAVARRYRLTPYNTIAFPRALRDAIPDLHGGRVLKLASVTAGVSRAEFFGEHIQLNLTASETGALSGEFVVRVDLLPEAARILAATLARLADDVEPQGGATV